MNEDDWIPGAMPEVGGDAPAAEPAAPATVESGADAVVGAPRRLREFFGGVVRDEMSAQLEPVIRTLDWMAPGAAENAGKPLPVKPTLAAFIQHSAMAKRGKTLASDVPRLLAFFEATGAEDLRKVTPALVHAFLVQQAKERAWSGTTYNRYREQLHALFAWLLDQELVNRNPVAKVPRMPKAASSIRHLSPEQLERALELARRDQYIAAFVWFVAFTGVRRGEAQWLTWADVDFERWLVSIRAKEDGSWQPKTRRNRIVPVQTRLRPVLEQLRDDMRSRTKRGGAPEPWVFTAPMGGQWEEANLSKRFAMLLRPQGLAWTFLDLRHTFATRLAAKGVSLAKIAALMGNSPAVCRTHYAHVTTEDLHEDVEF